MKFIRLATIAALSTTILAGGAVSAFADDATTDSADESTTEVRKVTTDGQIQFTADEEGELEVIPPVTDPDVIIPPIVDPVTGPLSIVQAPTMNFGSQVISNQDQTYNMVAEMAKLANPEEDGPTEVPYISFAQVQDVRGTNAGWDLQVSLSDFTSSTQNNILTGAQIELVNSRIQYEGSNQANSPVNHTAGLKLIPNAGAVSVMTASEGKGAGASSVVWGDQSALDAQDSEGIVTNNAIQLSIPGSTAKDATTYTSTLTWELTTTPDDDAGEPDTDQTNPEGND
ncbi:WxL domain-containing protein [Enterococcus casseliflavus]|uniref:WxL domain-containing protein n=1 Tax=Enterococcus casseliflavus TaxID=37734 RepID=UPI00119DCFE0|nr:WxL domain-containing protein [Enterococcus casseliflavus]